MFIACWPYISLILAVVGVFDVYWPYVYRMLALYISLILAEVGVFDVYWPYVYRMLAEY